MNSKMISAGMAILGAAMTTGCGGNPAPGEAATDPGLLARASAIHQRAITMDTHVDINPSNFTPERSYATRLPTQVDLVKMEEGGLDAAFLVVYVGQQQDFSAAGFARAQAQAIAKFDAIHRLVKELAPGRAELALTAADVRRIEASGKRVILIGVENAYPIGEDLANVKRFYDLGARYMSLAHNGHNHLSDSNTGERDGVWRHNGLSPLGWRVVAEMNRVGIMVDISHPSKEANRQTMAMSRAPVIASHSAARALAGSSRNLEDDELLMLKENGGVVQTVAFNSYVKTPPPDSPERVKAIADLRKEFNVQPEGTSSVQALPAERRTEYMGLLQELNQKYPPPPRATVSDFVDHIDHIVQLIGIDHVGISSDFDGGGGVTGWNNASETLNVTVELVKRGYTEEQILKLWGGNLLRVMERVEQVAREIQAGR
jgi:microsomal dipeptidase-like Zn-dependent dipeptidase